MEVKELEPRRGEDGPVDTEMYPGRGTGEKVPEAGPWFRIPECCYETYIRTPNAS